MQSAMHLLNKNREPPKQWVQQQKNQQQIKLKSTSDETIKREWARMKPAEQDAIIFSEVSTLQMS